MKKNQSLALRTPGLSLRGVADVVFRKKWLILITLLTAGTAAAVFAWMAPDMYESRMKFLVRNMRSEVPLTPGSETTADRSEVSQAQINSEMELLKSRDLLEQVVREVDLAEPEKPGTPLTEQDIEKAVRKLEKDLDVSSVKKGNIISVNYASKSPETSAHVLKKLSELYLDKHLELHRPPGAFEFFKEQADQYEKDLRSAENRLSDFQQKKDVVVLDQQKELTLGRLVEARAKLRELNGTIEETDKKIAALNNQLKSTEQRITTQNRVLPNQYSAERLNTMLVELKNRRIQLAAKFHPNDRIVREVDEQIEETTAALKKATEATSVEQSTDVNPLRQSLESELSRTKVDQAGRIALRKNLTEQVAEYEAKLENLEKASPVYDNLSRQVKQNEEVYQLYAKKQEESRINDALDEQKISNVSIAEEPSLPATPNNSSRILAVVLGLGLGLGICVGSVFVSELARDTFLSPAELEAFTDYPVLATIPLQAEGHQLPGDPAEAPEPENERSGMFEEEIDDVIAAHFSKYRDEK